jgi:hypothetical protein
MLRIRHLSSAALFALLPCSALAATYTVGPAGSGAQYTQLGAVFSARDLTPGDIVLVKGGATYNGGVVVEDDDSGTAANPVIIKWDRTGGTRPKLQGGEHTVKFQESNHIVFEGFDVTGGSKSCIFNGGHNVTVRDSVIHDCPAHGVLGADDGSGSFTLEYNEIYNAGANDQKHPIYMTSDAARYPGSVFLMRYNYVHDGKGGNLIKSRHERNLIYYNWLEGGVYQEIELIGPDCAAWPNGNPPNINADSDVVGNVIIHTSTTHNSAIRLGGDLNGRSRGLVRLVNNTILIDRAAGGTSAVLVQLGLKGLEMHNNVIYQPSSTGAPAILSENNNPQNVQCGFSDKRPWLDGVRRVAGSDNWVESTATQVPSEWVRTSLGIDPLLTNIAQRKLRPGPGSPLLNRGNNAPTTPAGFPFPSPLTLPAYDPPLRAKLAIGDEHARLPLGAPIDIGALEEKDIDDFLQPIRVNGSQPLIPPRPGAQGQVNPPVPAPSISSPAAVVRNASPPSGSATETRRSPSTRGRYRTHRGICWRFPWARHRLWCLG